MHARPTVRDVLLVNKMRGWLLNSLQTVITGREAR